MIEEEKDENNQSNIEKNDNNEDSNYSQKSNILVALRVRPLTQKELILSNITTTSILNNKIAEITIPQEYSYQIDGGKYLNNEKNLEISKSKKIEYQFDLAFDENSTQQEVYQYTTSNLIKNVLDGYNSTVFAYGATGSGKTYTMVGDGEKPGIMVRAISDLFTMVYQKNTENSQYQIQISYVEIYNENVIDLLGDGTGGKIDILNDPLKGVVLMGTNIKTVKNASEAFKYLLQGNKSRKEDPTSHNEHSSRSHAILQIFISNASLDNNDKSYSYSNDVNEITFGKFILVDLAGSEKVTITQKPNNETHCINKSLLTLANCINSLLTKNKQAFIPWRDSKLTRMLKDSLGGNSKVIMISNVSPSILSLDETIYTVQFSNRVKNIKVTAKKNVVIPDLKIDKYEKAIENLKQEIEEVKREIASKAEITVPITSGDEKTEDDMNKYLSELTKHFEEEIKVVTEIIKVEQEISNLKIDAFVLKSQPKKERDKSLSVIRGKDSDILKNSKLLATLYTTQSKLNIDRRPIQSIISKLIKEDSDNPNSNRGKLLLSAYKYYIGLIENMKLNNRVYLSGNDIKKKDKEIEILTRQLSLRDQFIVIAEGKIKQNKGEIKMTHKSNFIPTEEIENDPCIFLTKKKEEHNKSFSMDSSLLESKPNSLNMNSTRISMKRMYNAEILPLLKSDKGKDNNSFLKNFKLKSRKMQNSKSSIDIFSPKVIFSSMKKTNNPVVVKKYTGNKSFSLGKVDSNGSRNIFQATPLVANKKDHKIINYSSCPEIGKNLEKKVKTILCRNIIGRYKNSPYILKQAALG